jgi:hypothetical protein
MWIKSVSLARHVGIYENRLKMPIKSVNLARHVRIYEIRLKMLIKFASLARHVGIYENVKWQIRARSKSSELDPVLYHS